MSDIHNSSTPPGDEVRPGLLRPVSAGPVRLISEESVLAARGVSLPASDVPEQPLEELLPAEELRGELNLPEVSELDVVRHFTRLSTLNFSVDTGFYPLGSCTMKYNPKLDENVAALPGFRQLHPLQPTETVQGALAVLYHLEQLLAAITGMAGVSSQPVAGAHGELTGILMARPIMPKPDGSAGRCLSPIAPTAPTRQRPRWPATGPSPWGTTGRPGSLISPISRPSWTKSALRS